MKKFLNVVILASFVLLPPITRSVLAGSKNLIANPSVEISKNNLPTDWVANNWGDLRAEFFYLNDGQNSSHSVKVAVTDYKNGDAKWYFTPVSVEPGTAYVYETYYKSSVSSEVVAQITDNKGNISYQWLKTVPANDSGLWLKTNAEINSLSDTAKISIFHVVNSNGWLQTDNTFFGVRDFATGPNDGELIPNPSLEAADDRNANKPAWWSSNSWGNNKAKFSYETDGYESDRSVKTEVTSHVDGDAKWYVDPVNVKPNQKYTYSHYYKSNIETQVVAAFINASGEYSYEWLQNVPATDTWSSMNVQLTTPANTQKLSIYHIVDKIGWLQIDNANMNEYTTNPNTEIIPNSSLENTVPTNNKLPANWLNNSWGSNNAKFDYLQTGRTGTRSIKVSVSNYFSGDAKWYFNPITTLTPGKQYRFSAWYKTNTNPKVVAMFNRKDGTTQYFGLPSPFVPKAATTEWQLYDDTFTVPSDAVSTSVFMFIDSNGWLQTDDYAISNYEANGFIRPLVTLTFDDGHEDNVTNALPLLNQYGFKTTQCYATQHVKGKPKEIQNVLNFYNSGHEICSHTISHPFLTTLNKKKLEQELNDSKKILENIIGQPVLNFASPYGDYNQSVNNEIAK